MPRQSATTAPRPNGAKGSSRPGFTLVELAVAIALMATLLTIGYPSFADWLARKRVLAAAEVLQADMSEARFQAAQRGQTVYLGYRQDASSWCWTVATATPCDCSVPQACRIRAVPSSQHRGVALASTFPTHFTPDGQGEGAAELRSSRGHVLRVAVARLGRAYLCVPGGGDAQLPAC